MPAAEGSFSDDDLFDIIYCVRSITEEHDLARISEARRKHAAEAHEAGAE